MSARQSGKPLWLIGPVGGMRRPFVGTLHIELNGTPPDLALESKKEDRP